MEYSIIWHWQRPLNGPWIGADYRACLIRTFVFEGTLFLILKHWIKGHIFGGNLFWYAAVFRTITAIRGAAVTDELLILDPKETRSLVVQHTYYLPKDGMERKILSWLEWNLKPCFSVLEWCYWRRSHQFYFFSYSLLALICCSKAGGWHFAVHWRLHSSCWGLWSMPRWFWCPVTASERRHQVKVLILYFVCVWDKSWIGSGILRSSMQGVAEKQLMSRISY